ncbi:MAG: alkaline phosphatase PhoX [Baekduiaceae bacterium]
MTGTVSRRALLRAGLLAGGALALGPAFYRDALAAAGGAATPGPGPYGVPSVETPLGIRIPEGFSVREIAKGGRRVPGTTYTWHIFTDGQAAFPAEDGGWILVSNSESLSFAGAGCSAIRFAPDGKIVDAYRTLANTQLNCAGGPTPWGTWLSGEEYEFGHMWEVDPTRRNAQRRGALGTFTHESACVDPVREQLYLTEDKPDGCFYRFTPTAYPDLSAGTLEAAVVDEATRAVTWVPVKRTALPVPTRVQARRQGAKRFKGGEGTWWDGGVAYFTTKGDNRVWAYDCEAERIDVLYDATATGPDAPLRGVDNICVSRSGDLYVCEDGDDLDVCFITPDHEVARFCTFDKNIHLGTELVGATFDPSGTRLYVGSQRSFAIGALYEISGPFRQPPAPTRPPSFGRPLREGEAEAGAEDLVRVRARTTISRGALAAPGLGVRLALREPCVVRTTLRSATGVLAEHRFPTAVTALTALRLKAAAIAPGDGYEVVVRATPTAGGDTAEIRRELTVS